MHGPEVETGSNPISKYFAHTRGTPKIAHSRSPKRKLAIVGLLQRSDHVIVKTSKWPISKGENLMGHFWVFSI